MQLSLICVLFTPTWHMTAPHSYYTFIGYTSMRWLSGVHQISKVLYWVRIQWLQRLFEYSEPRVMFKKPVCVDLSFMSQVILLQAAVWRCGDKRVILNWSQATQISILLFSLHQILTLPSKGSNRSWTSSDTATFFQSSVVQPWWACLNCSLSFLF